MFEDAMTIETNRSLLKDFIDTASSAKEIYEQSDLLLKSAKDSPKDLKASLDPLMQTDPQRVLLITNLLLQENELSPATSNEAHTYVYETFRSLLPTASKIDPNATVEILNDLFGRALSEESLLSKAEFYDPGNEGYSTVVLGESALTASNIDEIYKTIQEIEWPDDVNLGKINSLYDGMNSRKKTTPEPSDKSI